MSILDNQSSEQGQYIPRLNCGGANATTFGSAMAGVSAFAFQGTNAHAILGKSSGLLARKTSNITLWKRNRAW